MINQTSSLLGSSLVIVFGSISAHGALTTYVGDAGTNDSLDVAANWNLGIPTSANEGLINVNAELSNLNVNTTGNVVLNHTAGNIGDLNGEIVAYRDATFQNSNGAGTLAFNISGTASYSNFRVLTLAGANTTTTINGGNFTATDAGGSRIQSNSNGILDIYGGTFNNGYFWADSTSVMSLLGGVSSTTSQGFRSDDGGSVLNIGGSFSLDSWKTDGVVFQNNNGVIDFNSGWSGSIVDRSSLSVWTNSEWITDLTTAGVSVDGTAITAGNFADYFVVDVNGTLSAVPEPSSTSLLGLAVLGLMIRRRR